MEAMRNTQLRVIGAGCAALFDPAAPSKITPSAVAAAATTPGTPFGPTAASSTAWIGEMSRMQAPHNGQAATGRMELGSESSRRWLSLLWRQRNGGALQRTPLA